MPEETGPPGSAILATQTTTTTVRKRRAPKPLTLDAFAIEVRGKFAAVESELETLRAQARGQADAAATALRTMIAEEVDTRLEARLAVLKADLQADLHAIIDPLVARRKKDEEVFVFVRNEIADRKVRVALEAERRDNLDGLVDDLRQSIVGVAGLVIAGKAQSQWGLPWWEFWPTTVFITVTCILWPVYKRLLRPKRRSTDSEAPGGRPPTQASADAQRTETEDSDAEEGTA